MIPAFLLPALIAGISVAIVSGYFGPFVVQRGLAFFGHGLGHAAFGGVALGILLGVEPLAIAVPFALLVALGIVWLQQHSEVGADTSIGIFFSLAMALGIIFLSMTPTYSVDATTYLFGSILSLTKWDALFSLSLLLLPIILHRRWGALALASFDRELAGSDHVSTKRDDYALAFALGLTIVFAMKLVGIVLISAFLVIPAAAARHVAGRFAIMVIVSILFGVLSVIGGIFLSYSVDLPTGPTIVIVQSLLFVLALLKSKFV